MSTFTTQDGFTWYIVQPHVAKYLHKDYGVYRLYDDESDALCEDGYNFNNNERYVIEHPSYQVVHALCGSGVIKAFELGDFEMCYELIFIHGRGDIAFFSPFAKPKEVLDALRICDAVMYINSNDFLRIVTNG